MATESIIEEVATNLEEVAVATRRIDTRFVGGFLGGVLIGAAVGFYFGYRYNREKIRAEILVEAEKTIAEIREVYRSTAVTSVPEKPALEDVVEEKVGPQKPVVPTSTEPIRPEVPKDTRPLKPPVVVRDPRVDDKDKHDGWNYPRELSQRTVHSPYIIHQDEYQSNESEYSQVTITYYDGDDVLADENDAVIENPDELIGMNNLIHWGHGADDINVVYIRNSKIEVEYEVCRSPKSYSEEVLGLENRGSDNDDEE